MSDFKREMEKMTDLQIKFLECIYKEDLSAKELCKKLRIKGDKTDKLAGYYNALNRAINYLTSDDGNEIDEMFRISFDKQSPVSDNDIYIITKQGVKYIEDYWKTNRNNRSSKLISIMALIVSIVYFRTKILAEQY